MASASLGMAEQTKASRSSSVADQRSDIQRLVCTSDLLQVASIAVTAPTDVEAGLDAAFAALADRTRRAIIGRLAQGEATVGELAAPFDLTHQAVSRHVGILRRCDLIHQRVDGQRRPCRLNAERMQQLTGWIIEQQREWASRLDSLDQHLTSLEQAETR